MEVYFEEAAEASDQILLLSFAASQMIEMENVILKCSLIMHAFGCDVGVAVFGKYTTQEFCSCPTFQRRHAAKDEHDWDHCYEQPLYP